jgi:opacity protein-like surface antigen
MKKITLIHASCISIAFLSITTVAADAFYVKPYVGISYMNDVTTTQAPAAVAVELEKGMVLGAAFGYQYSSQLAAEVSWEYRSNDSETLVGNQFYPEGNYAANLIFVNGIYTLQPMAGITPYVGLGVGWMQEIDIDLERNGVELSYSNSGKFSYQGFIGLRYPLSSTWSLHSELRHAGGKSGLLKDEKTKQPLADLNYKPFTWQFGVTYLF